MYFTLYLYISPNGYCFLCGMMTYNVQIAFLLWKMNQNAFKVKLEFCHHFKQVKDPDCYAFTVHTDMTWRSTVQTKAVYRYISFLLSLSLQENFKLLASIVVHPIHQSLHFMLCVIFVIKRKDFFWGWYFLLLLWPNWAFVQHKFSGFRQPADVSCSICKRLAGLGRGVDTNHGNQKTKPHHFRTQV